MIGAVLLTVAACKPAGSADPASGQVNFESTWDTATGTAKEAVTDGGRWPNYWEFNNGEDVQLLSVVPGGPNGHNALRVQQRGGHYAAILQIDDVLPQSRDFYVRFYMKNEDTSVSGGGDHVATVDFQNYGNLTFMRKSSDESGWLYLISMHGCGGGWPIAHWGPPARLDRDRWYRFEYFVHYTNRNHIQVHPRVYDMSESLLYDDDDFQQQSYKRGGVWQGRDDWTLASYYAAGHDFCVEPTWMNDFALGNNGQNGAVDTGLYWYFAAFQVRSDRWPGPVPASGDTAPPRVSLTAPTVPNGSHTLTAVARDAAGNQMTSAAVTVTVANAAAGIAALYPGDVGIESHPDVVFVEQFEEPTLPDLFARWTDIQNAAGQAFSADVPPGSTGSRSLDVSWEGGSQKTAGLYKVLSPGISDTLYVRYYIKYPATGMYRHEGIWMGGSNPPLTWPNPQAGIKPTGSDRFIAAAEQVDDRSRFDHYNYWMNMRAYGDGKFWGNLLLRDPTAQVTVGGWTCVEHMVKLNNPTTAFNGEHALWLNGVKISHLGPGFPNGTWLNARFTQNPAGSPFEGFRWRSDANLNLNWIWLLVYAPDDPVGFLGHIKYDHVVVAKNYIGCLAP